LMADILFAVLKIIAYEVDLATELLATRDEVQAVVRAHKEGRSNSSGIALMEGWRFELAGKKMLELLNGSFLSIYFDEAHDPPVRVSIKAKG